MNPCPGRGPAHRLRRPHLRRPPPVARRGPVGRVRRRFRRSIAAGGASSGGSGSSRSSSSSCSCSSRWPPSCWTERSDDASAVGDGPGGTDEPPRPSRRRAAVAGPRRLHRRGRGAVAEPLGTRRDAGTQRGPIRPYVEGVLGHARRRSAPSAPGAPASGRWSRSSSGASCVSGRMTRSSADLAERWDVDEAGGTWTFHLRPGLVWQDGQPLTSADVLFTIAALSDPDYVGPGAASWGEVSASAPDERTVRLTLATPLGGFLQAATPAHRPAPSPRGGGSRRPADRCLRPRSGWLRAVPRRRARRPPRAPSAGGARRHRPRRRHPRRRDADRRPTR